MKPTPITLEAAKVGMIFAEVEHVEYADGAFSEEAGSLYEIIEIVTESWRGDDPCFKPHAVCRCVDYDDSDRESIFSFPFSAWVQA